MWDAKWVNNGYYLDIVHYFPWIYQAYFTNEVSVDSNGVHVYSFTIQQNPKPKVLREGVEGLENLYFSKFSGFVEEKMETIQMTLKKNLAWNNGHIWTKQGQ